MQVVAAPESRRQIPAPASQTTGRHSPFSTGRLEYRSTFAFSKNVALAALLALLFFSLAPPVRAREHKRKVKAEDYGLGFSTEISAPESEVLQAVEEIVNDGIIQGSKEFNKDKFIDSATTASSTSLFPEWKEPGKVYYKVRTNVLAPLNFKDSKDEGTVAVRYVVLSKDPSKTILRIDAVFAEDFRRTVHASDGSVENAECQDVQDHIEAAQALKKQMEERDKQREEKIAAETLARNRKADEASALVASQTSAQTQDQRLNALRHQAERVVKAPGGQLKTAPFHSASNVKPLEGGAEVVILVVTPYWYGVETTDGQHGWINRHQLEPLP